jgi:hypothetical protein
VPVFVGPRLQKMTLIIDSGSSLTTFPCEDCGTSCGGDHWDEPYKNSQSDSFKYVTCKEELFGWSCRNCADYAKEICTLSIGYVEGSSYKGRYSQDFLLFKDEIQTFNS